MEGDRAAIAKDALRVLTMDDLPPFGFMPDIWQSEVRRGDPPEYWERSRPEWTAFVEALRKLIGDSIWPCYGSGKWEATPATATAPAMTMLDLDLIVEWQASLYRKVAWEKDPMFTTHEEFFNLEDDRIWHDSLIRYCPALASMKEATTNMYMVQLDRRISDCVLALKWRFQRPRPHLAAYLQGRKNWFWTYAKTSLSPSMVSGHALQGCLFGCLMYSVVRRIDDKLARANRTALQKWMMGVGDRRVFAGVHYPSDNVGSWIVASRLIPEVIKDAEVPGFLREAILGASHVHDELRKVARQARGAPLAQPLQALDAALGELASRT